MGCHSQQTNGGFVGVETSLSRVNGNRLLGLSGDVLWDTGLDGVSATVGPDWRIHAGDGWRHRSSKRL